MIRWPGLEKARLKAGRAKDTWASGTEPMETAVEETFLDDITFAAEFSRAKGISSCSWADFGHGSSKKANPTLADTASVRSPIVHSTGVYPPAWMATIVRPQQLYAALRDLAAEVSAGELPEFLAEVERARWTAQLRVGAVRPLATGGRESLLTAEQVADWLQVSEAQVYRLAKTALRSAAVEFGPGTLRFDSARLARFIEGRRRGD
jgi:hypothetical protein